MPEIPDFRAIAQRLAHEGSESGPAFVDRAHVDAIAEQLRSIWNARGAADLALLERDVTHAMSSPFLKPVGDQLVSTLRMGFRTLDGWPADG